ncbi:MAG TPA: GNVR domain-containing protein, partial [Chitinophagaceae bacterium]|nr:GNVR domain-containing protein [Chitinophagaceae bacterium]
MQENIPAQPNTTTNANSELWNLTIRDLFFKYIRFLPLFILSIALALFGAYAYLRYATEIYSTTSTMVIAPDATGAKGDKFDEIFSEGKKVNIQSEIEVLKSRALMARVIQKQNLQYSYSVKGKIKTVNIYKYGPFVLESDGLTDSSQAFTLKIKALNENEFRINDNPGPVRFGETFSTAHGRFRLVRQPGASLSKDYTISYEPTGSLASYYSRAVMVAPKVTGTNIINISLQSTNPRLAADVVNQLMEEYGAYTKELKNQTSDQTLAFIDNRMEVLGRELDSVQNILLRYTQDNNLIDIEAQTGAYFDNVSAADKAINEQQMQLSTAEFIETYLRDKKNNYGPVIVPSSLGLNDPTLNELVNQYNSMQISRQQLLDGNVPSAHPAIKEASEQIEKLRISLLENLSNIKNSMRKTIASLRQNSGEAQGQLKVMPYKVKGYLELKKQVDNKQALFNILQEKREQTAIARAANVANSQIVERAYVSYVPIKPNRRSIQLMAILIGLAIPALFVF